MAENEDDNTGQSPDGSVLPSSQGVRNSSSRPCSPVEESRHAQNITAASRNKRLVDLVDLNLKNAKDRLVTFELLWPKESKFKDVASLAAQGHYCFDGLNIQCVYCDVRIGDLKENDDPRIRHQQLSPNCRFINGEDTGDIPLSPGEEGAAASCNDSTQTIPEGNDHLVHSAYCQNGNMQKGDVGGKYPTKPTGKPGDAEALLKNGTKAGTSEGVGTVNRGVLKRTIHTQISSISVANKAQSLELSGNKKRKKEHDLLQESAAIARVEERNNWEQSAMETNVQIGMATHIKTSEKRREIDFEEASTTLTDEEHQSSLEPTRSPENSIEGIEPNIPQRRNDSQVTVLIEFDDVVKFAMQIANVTDSPHPIPSVGEDQRWLQSLPTSSGLNRTNTLRDDVDFGAMGEPPPSFPVGEPPKIEGDSTASSTKDEDRGPNRLETIKKELEQLKQDQLCCACLTKKKNVLLEPCMHLCVCIKCAATLKWQCPLCKGEIRERKFVYL